MSKQVLITCALLTLTAAAPPLAFAKGDRELLHLAQDLQPGLVVTAGESWIFTVKDGQPAGARKVDASATPGKGELMVTLDPGPGGTMMSVVNNGAAWWNYRAFIVVKPGHKGNRTSVCTLMGGGRSAFEQWADPIRAIRIADFVAAGEGEMRCQ